MDRKVCMGNHQARLILIMDCGHTQVSARQWKLSVAVEKLLQSKSPCVRVCVCVCGGGISDTLQGKLCFASLL